MERLQKVIAESGYASRRKAEELIKAGKVYVNGIKITEMGYKVNGNDLIDIKINAKEGFDIAMENNNFIILNTTLTNDLINEGLARETISKIQQIRKASNFDVLDNIDIDFCGDDEIAQAVENFKDYIKSETLALEINRVDDESLEKHNLNDHMTGIKVTRK